MRLNFGLSEAVEKVIKVSDQPKPNVTKIKFCIDEMFATHDLLYAQFFT